MNNNGSNGMRAMKRSSVPDTWNAWTTRRMRSVHQTCHKARLHSPRFLRWRKDTSISSKQSEAIYWCFRLTDIAAKMGNSLSRNMAEAVDEAMAELPMAEPPMAEPLVAEPLVVDLSLAEALYSGILANSPTMVKTALGAGADPSVDHDGTSIYPPLSRAVDNCDKNYYNSFYDTEAAKDAVLIVDLLLEAGVSKSDLKHALKVACDHQNTNEKSKQCIKSVIQKILAHQQEVTTDFPPVPVACTVLQMLKHLLFSQEFSDVVFIFKDNGTKLYAHRCVLAAASPYFDRCFKGDWAEKEHKDGTWEAENSLEVMKAILTFIYTGKVKTSILETHPSEMLHVTNKFELLELQEVTENSCIERISMENIKSVLQMANLYKADKLKNGCFEYVDDHSSKLLVDPSFTSLGQEDPTLWSELCSFLQG